jgi:hypothetical protein
MAIFTVTNGISCHIMKEMYNLILFLFVCDDGMLWWALS